MPPQAQQTFGGSGWIVTGQATGQVVNTQAGQSVVGTEVYFVTGDGNEGSVFVPDNKYTARNVKQAIHERAALLDEVGRLTST